MRMMPMMQSDSMDYNHRVILLLSILRVILSYFIIFTTTLPIILKCILVIIVIDWLDCIYPLYNVTVNNKQLNLTKLFDLYYTGTSPTSEVYQEALDKFRKFKHRYYDVYDKVADWLGLSILIYYLYTNHIIPLYQVKILVGLLLLRCMGILAYVISHKRKSFILFPNMVDIFTIWFCVLSKLKISYFWECVGYVLLITIKYYQEVNLHYTPKK